MADTSSLRRTRQACGPCRRKKTKCPGERPICSYCRRLGQECVYAEDEGADASVKTRRERKMEHRLQVVESRLEQLLDQQGATAPSSVPPTMSSGGNHPVADERTQATSDALSDTIVHARQAGESYLRKCHCQPLALFSHEDFLDNLSSRDEEIQLIVLALAKRVSQSHSSPDSASANDMANKAYRRVFARLANGEVELSMMQSLCLLSMYSYYCGRFAQAELCLSLACHLAQHFSYTTGATHDEEYSMCIRSIVALQRLQGSVVTNSFEPTRDDVTELDRKSTLLRSEIRPHDNADIVDFTTQLSYVWYLARSYAAHRQRDEAVPPWLPHSDFSEVMVEHMRMDSIVPRRYRYVANDFASCSVEELQSRRHYWGPWLSLQFIYAAVPCLLNHPFLISLRLRNFRHALPQSFIQQSYEQITRHGGWIMHFLELLEKASVPFDLYDPVLAHCVVIVATIHLQHSFVEDQDLRTKSRAALEQCMRFLRRMGATWPIVRAMACNLHTLHANITSSSATGRSGRFMQLSAENTRLLGDLLVYEKAGREQHSPDLSLCGRTLASVVTQQVNSIDALTPGYDLVGTTGISGHSANPADNPINAPTLAASSTARAVPGSASLVNDSSQSMLHTTMHTPLLEGMGNYLDDNSLFLQVDDHGRAIESWFELDLDV